MEHLFNCHSSNSNQTIDLMMYFFEIAFGILFFLISLFFAMHFILPLVLFLIHWLLPKDPKKILARYKNFSEHEFDFAAIITAHQDARFIPPLVDSLLRQHYKNFVVYVVADDCDISELNFPDERIVLLNPENPLHAKIKSIRYAIDHYIREHDALVIFDSDNLAHPEYLRNLNQYFQKGFKVVQTNMFSKNIDSNFAKLDSLGHTYHNFLERQVKMEMGFTSSILGLGLAIDMDIYREVAFKNELGGFDKKLQIHLTESVPMIAFGKDAIVYDEKVENAAAFEKQRTRWIFTYFEYFKENFSFLMRSVSCFNFGRILLGFSMMRPPMFLTIFLSVCCMIISFWVYPLSGWIWICIFALYTLNFMLIIATQSQQKGIFKALFLIPAMIFRQFKSLLRIGRAKKAFLKTEHQHVLYIQDVLEKV